MNCLWVCCTGDDCLGSLNRDLYEYVTKSNVSLATYNYLPI
jgi:hypothetical protein